ncbi:polypeptide N-acetylgalactosaminyltransferase 1-like [Mizuhopecten yessoensis]|uniref:Polypeptide N-acetylgalactosaminyltransferase n=1 Tax=Mizuhopecten yessoensis TaxID=6573 RepID=A0A210PV43_MIZYE|nr:polypeptide N-acetylgalactosaminyltransferase 1-like [Mizuhopecten yessoensis]OWF40367.1 Polypeptide N-acetylgalactosaminyltransferase 5 [Mizuhopecten yessoensis]
MAKSGRAKCGFRRLLPALLLFILGQTWIILMSLPQSFRQLETERLELAQQQRGVAYKLSVMEDEKYTSKLERTLQSILARHQNVSDTVNHNYNVSAGNSISVRRSVPDTRLSECHNITYPIDTTYAVSVVIIFHNEALSTLLRTVHSVIDRSPEENLKGVILVDDFSTMTYLKDELDMYLSLVPKARVIRNRQRAGLVRSRMNGARNATGDVLVFFDAHMECNTRWLEPLLHVLKVEPTAILQPVVDIIAAKSMEYYAYDDGRRYRGGFGWDMRYSWFVIPEYLELAIASKTTPFITPVLVGNAIAVRRDHFFRIGGFDEGLDIWGGEHFDLSFKNWMCAGRVLTVPCSKVGHLFKEGQSYSFDGDRYTIIQKNLMRVAEIWMDEYKDVFYRIRRARNANFPVLDQTSLRKQKNFIKSLNCKTFRWYLQNVLPEQKVPPIDAAFYGEITNVRTTGCLTVLDDFYIGITFDCFKYRILPINSFTFTKNGKFKYNDRCVFVDNENRFLKISTCDETRGVFAGKWSFVTEDPAAIVGSLHFEISGSARILCVGHVTGVIQKVHFKEQMAQGINCNKSSYLETSYQNWFFMYKLV